ncbi:MAG: hypothetical protein WC314_19870 [Vulcanimicrobiota bacterium]
MSDCISIRLTENESEDEEGPRKASLLVESSIVKSGSRAEVILIESGWSKNGKYYSEQVLREAMPLFERKPISVYGFGSTAKHLDQGYRDFTPGFSANIAGWSVGVREGVGEQGRFALVADFEVARQDIRDLLLTADKLAEGARFPLGLSIDAQGAARRGVAEGRAGLLVERIEHVFETTLVERPAAGGKILRLTASDERKVGKEVKKLRDFLILFARRAKISPGEVATMQESEVVSRTIDVLHEMDNGESLVKLAIKFLSDGKQEEAIEALTMLADGKAPEEEPEEAPAEGVPAAIAEAQSVTQAARVELAQARLSRVLQESQLPDTAVASLRKRFAGRDFQLTELTEAVDDVRSLLVEAQPKSGPVQESHDVSITHDARDKFSQALDLVFGYEPEKAELSEGERAQYKSLGRVRSIKTLIESYQGNLQESTTNDIPYHLGVSMNRRMKQLYAEHPSFFDEVVTEVNDISDFKEHEVLQWGGFGQLPTVAERGQYTSLGFPREERKAYKVDKKGGTVDITREMLKNDDLGLLRDIPVKIARAARNNINTFKGGFVAARLSNGSLGSINSSTTYDGKAIYHAHHFNLGASALGYDSFVAANLRLDNQKDWGLSTQLNGGIDGSTGTLTVDSNEGFQVGDEIQIDAEIMKITVVNVNGTGLTVTREAAGTTGAPHDNDARVYQLTAPIPFFRKHLWVPYELRGVAHELLYSDKKPGGDLNNVNYVAGLRESGVLTLHAVPRIYLGDDINNWYLTGDKTEVEMGRMAFMDGRQDPEIILQDSEMVGDVFNKDVHTYKVRHEYGGVITDWRGQQGSIVSN